MFWLECSSTQLRLEQKQKAAQPPTDLLAHLGGGMDAAEELGVTANDCSAVCQRLGELRGF